MFIIHLVLLVPGAGEKDADQEEPEYYAGLEEEGRHREEKNARHGCHGLARLLQKLYRDLDARVEEEEDEGEEEGQAAQHNGRHQPRRLQGGYE